MQLIQVARLRGVALRRLFLWIACLGLGSAAVWAAINPQEFKDDAPEHLEIKILERSVLPLEGVPSGTSVSLKAEVLQVTRTATELKAGDTLLIRYSQDPEAVERQHQEQRKKAEQGWVGPQVLFEPEPPDVGQTRKAYLQFVKQDGAQRVYRPAAHQYSFDAER